jgi:molybdopterin-biosynthesis enzyme MoeA-like protein
MMAVGRELLIGRTVNTNAHWLGRRLALMGSMLARIATVDDDIVEISSSLKSVLRRHPDFLLVVGGSG